MLEIKLSKLEQLEDSTSYFEDRDAIVLEEMEEKIILRSPWKLIEYYKLYPLFSDHLLLKICIQIQFILSSLSKSDE